MSELKFTIPRSLWLTANGRYHWAVKARATRDLRSIGWAESVAADLRHANLGPTHVAAHIGYLRNGTADPCNAAPTVKALIDGMVDAGVWPDDDSIYVVRQSFLRDPKSPTPGHYTVRLTLTPQEPQ